MLAALGYCSRFHVHPQRTDCLRPPRPPALALQSRRSCNDSAPRSIAVPSVRAVKVRTRTLVRSDRSVWKQEACIARDALQHPAPSFPRAENGSRRRARRVRKLRASRPHPCSRSAPETSHRTARESAAALQEVFASLASQWQDIFPVRTSMRISSCGRQTCRSGLGFSAKRFSFPLLHSYKSQILFLPVSLFLSLEQLKSCLSQEVNGFRFGSRPHVQGTWGKINFNRDLCHVLQPRARRPKNREVHSLGIYLQIIHSFDVGESHKSVESNGWHNDRGFYRQRLAAFPLLAGFLAHRE